MRNTNDPIGSRFHAIQNSEVIADFGLLDKADDVKVKLLRQQSCVLSWDVAGINRVPQRGLQVTAFSFSDFLGHQPNRFILRTQFAA